MPALFWILTTKLLRIEPSESRTKSGLRSASTVRLAVERSSTMASIPPIAANRIST